jgi:hypothetical protein
MRYSVCIIDNDIPASGVEAQALGIQDSQLLNASNLQLLLQKEAWPDAVIKSLTEKLFEQKDSDNITPKWAIYGLTHPSLFITALDHDFFRPDLIVFDWEYPATGAGAGIDSEDSLKQILEKTFCLIFVFSKPDKAEEIKAILDKPEFKEYKNRLFYLDKTSGTNDQASKLISEADRLYADNFSFKFADGLRKKSVQIMDRILSELGRATLSDVKNYLKLEEGGAKRDLVDFVAERFRAGLVASDIPDLVSNTSGAAAPDNDLVKRIWSYRLYLPIDNTINPGDELVRRGDVVKCSDEYFLVVSADCDLKRFWRKNFGLINLLPLHRLHNSNLDLKEVLTFCVAPGDLKDGEFKHLTDKMGKLVEGPFILPFLKIGDAYENFVIMPKELIGKQIDVHTDVTALPKNDRKNAQLKYAWWNGTEKICSVSEPFLTAIIQHTFGVIGGYGVPDYPNPIMKNIFEGILNDFISTPAAATPSTPE